MSKWREGDLEDGSGPVAPSLEGMQERISHLEEKVAMLEDVTRDCDRVLVNNIKSMVELNRCLCEIKEILNDKSTVETTAVRFYSGFGRR